MFTLGFSDPPPPPITYTLCVGYCGGVAKYKLRTSGEGGVYYFADQSGQGGINQFFCGRPL